MSHNWQEWFHALCYEAGLWAVARWPSLAFRPWFKMLMAHCRPDWAQWKTKTTLEAVDRQAKELVKQWDEEERTQRSQALADKAQALFPDATVVALANAVVPSVMIIKEAAPDASEEVKALGGELRITYQLHQD